MGKKKTSILIVDDHQVVAEGLKNLLELDGEFEIVGHCISGGEAVSASKTLKPDLIIMDITMPLLNGIEASRKILKTNPGIRILALTMNVSRNLLLESLKSGMKGFVLKESSFKILLAAIRDVMTGKMYVDPSLAGSTLNELVSTSGKAPSGKINILSNREREILQMISEGKSIKEIAFQLNISPKTVRAHRSSIMEKLHLDNNVTLTRFAIQEGLTFPWH